MCMKSAFIAALGVRSNFLNSISLIAVQCQCVRVCVAHTPICVTNVPLEWNETLLVIVPMVFFVNLNLTRFVFIFLMSKIWVDFKGI